MAFDRYDGEEERSTQCQDEVRILSGRTQKLKVAKRCWTVIDKSLDLEKSREEMAQ